MRCRWWVGAAAPQCRFELGVGVDDRRLRPDQTVAASTTTTMPDYTALRDALHGERNPQYLSAYIHLALRSVHRGDVLISRPRVLVPMTMNFSACVTC